MNVSRRNFLKSMLGVMAVAAVAPTLLLPKASEAAVPVAKSAALDQLNVRLLTLQIEKDITSYIKTQLMGNMPGFELNDDHTRQAIVHCTSDYLSEIYRRRGIEDFRVICDESNNTPHVIDHNGLVVDIFVQPKKTPVFHHLNFRVHHTGVWSGVLFDAQGMTV